MSSPADFSSEELMDNTLLLDFEQMLAEEARLAAVDRGLSAAQARRSTRSRGLGEPELEEIDMADVGEIIEIDEGFSGAVDVFVVEEVTEEFFVMEITSAEGFLVLDEEKKLDLSAIVQEPLPKNEYYPEEYEKRQIYLHHTVSPGDPMISINWWNQDRSSRGNRIRVATCIVVAGTAKQNSPYKDGQIYQCFPSGCWAHHLGVSGSGNAGRIPSKYHSQSHNVMLNKQSIGIELASWGPVSPLRNGNFAPYDHYKAVMKKHGSESFIKREIPAAQVIEYPNKYRGFRYFQKYTPAQIESTRQLLDYFCKKYNIPRDFDESMFKINERALRGDRGIFTHTSVRADKSDCHPQPELIEMLRNL